MFLVFGSSFLCKLYLSCFFLQIIFVRVEGITTLVHLSLVGVEDCRGSFDDHLNIVKERMFSTIDGDVGPAL